MPNKLDYGSSQFLVKYRRARKEIHPEDVSRHCASRSGLQGLSHSDEPRRGGRYGREEEKEENHMIERRRRKMVR